VRIVVGQRHVNWLLTALFLEISSLPAGPFQHVHEIRIAAKVSW